MENLSETDKLETIKQATAEVVRQQAATGSISLAMANMENPVGLTTY